mmetsp:Transcript_25259/g.39107  ORF Transcript_25259/g.39107 Transcript_25259/m.39107 type:complete len:293 (+) Transcript_25259:110-988(+)|eukprot:CAMPEP_0196821776 /NCGR_PEP_ID=MMETSP1362-20130617/80848_1 /TAXON_ID=163516 /ORGANISM="Leptocylindrus danicus, Strain CCMP1856" /LENGTH=292 /DNA_ID=CAMNT_0042201109 /DNA_START=35 /DNA_END=913 /DNA_ORIENTATION=+
MYFSRRQTHPRRPPPQSTSKTKEMGLVKPMWSDDTDALIAELAKHEKKNLANSSTKRSLGALDTYEHGGVGEMTGMFCTSAESCSSDDDSDNEGSIDESVDCHPDSTEAVHSEVLCAVFPKKDAKQETKPPSLKDTLQCNKERKKLLPTCLPETSTDLTDHRGDEGGRARKVSFDEVEVREYPIRLGDHPDCSAGPPLTIAWDPVRETHYSVNKFESMREPMRRHNTELKLSYLTRKCALMELCYSDADLRRAMVEVRDAKQSREQSAKHSKSQFSGLRSFFVNIRRRRSLP